MSTLHDEAVMREMETTTNRDRFEELARERKLGLEEEYQTQVEEINNTHYLNDAQKKEAILDAKRNYDAQVIQTDQELEMQREAVLQRYVTASNNAAMQFGFGFAQESKKAMDAL